MKHNKFFSRFMQRLNFSIIYRYPLKILFLCIIFGYSYSVASPVYEHYTADDFIQVKNIISKLEHHKTVIFLDFDETVACSKATLDGREYRLLPCPDLLRTYGYLTRQTQTPLEILKKIPPHFDQIRQYDVLDVTLIGMIQDFKTNGGAYVGICSGLPYCSIKKEVLRQVGLSKYDYHFGSSKAHVICDILQDKFDANIPITTIVLIDNSYEHVLSKFFEQITPLIEMISCLSHDADIKIITIEYRKFTNNLNLDDLMNELTWWHASHYLKPYND